MMWRKLSLVLILVILSSLAAEAKDACPKKCDCSEDLTEVKCRGMEQFPVFDFAKKVETLDLTHGKIKTIHESAVKAYENLEKLFISDNPLECDHATTHTLKYLLRESLNLKAYDGHKIKCRHARPKFIDDAHMRMAAGGLVHHGLAWAWPSVHFHGVHGHSMTPGIVAGVACLTILSLIAVTGVCWIIAHRKRRSRSSSDEQVSDAVDPVIKMEEGISTKAGYDSDTTDRMLMECLKKQRRGSQGYPENALVDSEDDDVVEQEDYLREKMKKQRRLSQGYADGSGSSDEESTMVEINLNEDVYSSGN